MILYTVSQYPAKIYCQGFQYNYRHLPRTPEHISVLTSTLIHLKNMYITEKYDKQVVMQTFHGKVTANVYVLPTT